MISLAMSLLLMAAPVNPNDSSDLEEMTLVLQGSEVSILYDAARRAGLSPEKLECYDVVVERARAEIRIGFVPATPITIVDGNLRKGPTPSCELHSFLYAADGRFIKRLRERDHSVIR